MKYFLIRVYDSDGKPMVTRCEKAKGPREACKLAYGVVYDRLADTARYKCIGGRKPAYATEKKKAEWHGPEGWAKIPNQGL